VPQIKKLLLILLCITVIIHGAYILYNYFNPKIFTSAQELVMQGMIVGIPHIMTNKTNFIFKTTAGLIMLEAYQKNLQLVPGQEWQFKINLKKIPYFNNPGEFNYQQYLREQGIITTGYVVSDIHNHLLSYKKYAVPIDGLRYEWYQKLLTATKNLRTQAILLALILGDKTLLNAVDRQSFERTGTNYFMVISGLHIVLFCMLVNKVARYAWSLYPPWVLKIPAPQVGLSVGLLFGCIYSLMAGALVPTQRALFMLLVIGLAKLYLRAFPSLLALGVAFILIGVWSPLVIMSVAFWMSFIAVFFLIFCFNGRLGKLKILEEWILPQWLMFWALLPIIIYTFNQFSVVALITNFLAMPIMVLAVIPTALLGAFLIWLWPKAAVLSLKISDFCMCKLLYLLHYFAFKWWWGMWLAQINFGTMLLGLLGACLIFLPKGIPGRWVGWCLFIPVLLPLAASLQNSAIIVTKLATENGTAEIWRTEHHVLLLENLKNLRAAHRDLHHIIEAYCIYAGIHQIDLWVINTSSNYHVLLGLLQDMPKLSLKKIAHNHAFNIYDSRLLNCAKLNSWQWDGVTFTLAEDEQKLCTLQAHKNLF
jgi:competence protein ComEC